MLKPARRACVRSSLRAYAVSASPGPLPEDEKLLAKTQATTLHHQTAQKEWWSVGNAMTMCTVILSFGVIVMVLSTILAVKRLHRDTILKVVFVPLAVVSALFLVVAGYNDAQIAPVMGLLGTIVGYVFGTSRPQGAQEPEKP